MKGLISMRNSSLFAKLRGGHLNDLLDLPGRWLLHIKMSATEWSVKRQLPASLQPVSQVVHTLLLETPSPRRLLVEAARCDRQK